MKARLTQEFVQKYNVLQKMFEGEAKISFIIDDLLLLKAIERERSDPDFALIKVIEKDIQKLYYSIIIEKLFSLEFPLYLPYYYDFRGRIYSGSPVDPMYLKVMRPFYKINTGLDLASLKLSPYFKFVIGLRLDLGEKISSFLENDVDTYFVRILFFEIGKLKKNKIIKVLGNTFEEFALLGLSLYLDEPDFSIEDYAYYLSIKASLDYFFTNKI